MASPVSPLPETHLSSLLSPKSPKYTSSPNTIIPSRPSQRRIHPFPSRCLRIVFTGGHIYPAIAIAEELKIAHPESNILFIGAPTSIETTAITSSGLDYTAIPQAILSLSNLLLPFHLLHSIASSFTILRHFRPHVVISTGGHLAALVCLATTLSGIKLLIQEQNAVPGLTNRVLAHYADKVFVAFTKSLSYFPKDTCVVCGNPVRLSLRRYVSKPVARSHFFSVVGVKSEKAEFVLVLCGSSGANSINIAMLNMYYDMLAEHKNRFIIWQTGVEGYSEMESLVRNHRRLLLTPFLHAMDLAYAAADIVVSRAGAMTCTEILTTGKPSILIPSPNFVDNHQTTNAYIMADIAGSKVLEEDELDSSSLQTAINEVLGDESLMAEMSQKALSAARPNAATEIAQWILSMVKLSSPK